MTKKKTYRFDSAWINKLETKFHWELYWKQQKVMSKYLNPNSSLVEMGVGSGFCANYLRSKGHKIRTIDIDASKKPDVVCNLKNWIPDFQYDGFLAFEIFEHVPFNDLYPSINNLSKAKVNFLYISVPFNTMNRRNIVSFEVKIANWKEKRFEFRYPFFGSTKIRTPAHHWELGKDGITLEKYLKIFTDNDYKIIEKVSYRHRFFLVAVHKDLNGLEKKL